jgi:hypothetical protein
MGLFLPCVGGFMPCFAVEVFEMRSVEALLVNRGCPQKEVLFPLLWNIVVDGLLRRLHNAHY